jgi:RimJ/RimL family protein N-acetyltransferase/quercetin dioxygenase-like cupin family protein
MTLQIGTERLILRRFGHADVPDFLAFLSQPSVARAAPEIEATEAGVTRYIDMQNSYEPFEQGKAFDLAIERKSDGKVIGLVTLVRRAHDKAAIGWALGVEYRGQGFATEAARALMDYGFRVLELHRIQATTNSDNGGSWRVMERLGMRLEGRQREAELQDGKWVDILTYGLLADEWQSPPAPAAASTVAGPQIAKVNLAQKFALFDDLWSPKIVGELNGQQVKLARFKGTFVWHHHEAEDELFLVVKGCLVVQLRERDVTLEEGEFIVVPRGVEHRPMAQEEAQVLLFEPVATLNTGNVQSERTREELESI